MKAKILTILFVLCFGAYSQVITWTPTFATHQDSITVIFNAAQGNKGLMGYTGDVYAHTGVITNLSINPSDWKYVKSNWGQNTAETKLTRIGTDLYEYKIKPSIRAFYAVPTAEQILKVAFVFRSSSSPYREGKTAEGGDIFLPLSTQGLNVTFISPTESPIIKNLNDTVNISVASANSNNLALYINNTLITQTPSTTINYNYIANTYGKIWIKATATGLSGDTKSDSIYVVVRGAVTVQDPPTGLVDGINYSSNLTRCTLMLYAPYKEFVYVIGDFNNWQVDPNYYMKKSIDGNRFWIEINNLTPGTEYAFQYFVDGKIKVADPYADKILDPWNDKYITSQTYPDLKPYPTDKTTQIVSVLQTAQSPYVWQTTNYQRPKVTDLVIYELLLRDFLAAHDYQTLLDTLNYLKTLGVNAIELMPIMEFDGNLSWGYNPAFHFAPDKYYGHKNKLKQFVDRAHSLGIAVIFDAVLNHAFGNNPYVRLWWDGTNNKPASNSPFFNPDAKHPYNVGYDFNHESQATKDYVDRFNKFWLQEYRVDGFRYDLSKGFTQYNSGGNVGLWGQYDQSRINLLKRMKDRVAEYDSTAYLILEHFAENNEETVLANYGFLLWGKMNSNYNEATMGYHDNGKSNLSWGYYISRGWSKPNLVTYMESHDEERLMYKNIQYGNSSGSYNIKNLNTALDRMKLAATFFFTIPGPKMIWQFGELGFDYSINYPCMTENCRTDQKPIKWDYLSNPNRKSLYKTYSALSRLKTNYEAFRTGNFTLTDNGAMKKIQINHSSMDIFVIGNFDVISASINPNFTKQGYWYDFFSGDSINVINPNQSITLQAGEFKLYTSVRVPPADTSSITSVIEIDESIPTEYSLSQNYPNPFNPNTVINYQLSNYNLVTLKIYDILGRLVETLVDKPQQPGIYSIQWDASKYSSGIYYYELKSGEFRSLKKMILIK